MNSQDFLLKKEVFTKTYHAIGMEDYVNEDFIYSIYRSLIPEIIKLNEHNINAQYNLINPMVLLNYIISEHLYSTAGLSKENVKALETNPQFITKISTIILDKYYTNEKLGYVTTSTENRFYPPISSLTLYLNFILNSLTNYQKGNPEETLLIDFLQKAFTMAKCIVTLLTQGFETEAFSVWRTFHEIECIIKILANSSKEAISTYLRHMDYGFAFRDIYQDKEKQDRMFVEIKEEMKVHDLKSKDMKKFIEYGWLYKVPGYEKIENFKLNFRDGVEEMAGLSQYSKWYEMSSEIAHSSPLLIYSNKKFFFDLTLLATLESFLRMEIIFDRIYAETGEPKLQEAYQLMRKTYLTQLNIIHELESKRFTAEHKLG